jgi:hypothetical protein
MKSMSRNNLANMIVFLAIILGAFIRFSPTILSGFAINDGGMFAAMIDDLKTSGYALPAFTSYNGLNIPYAYPPLGFYFGRIAADLLRLSSVEISRWLPAFFAALSVPAFYLLASRLMKTRLHAAIATLIFALMPRAMSWFVMGGGITRSPGQFFMLLTLACAVRLYKDNRLKDILWTGLFGSLAVLSHPEVAIHTAAGCLLFWLMLGHTRRSFLNSIQVAALVLVLTAPWWATVISLHGLAPLLSASQTGQNLWAVFHLVFFSFTQEIYATPIAILAIIGFGLGIIRRDYLLPIWLVVPFVVEGRSATAAAAVPLAMLAASAFLDIVLSGLRSAKGKDISGEQVTPVEIGVLIYLFTYLSFSAYLFSSQISVSSLNAPDLEAMQWVSQNTPGNSTFLVLTGSRALQCDAVSEWFPTLAQRKSIYTVQGTEWTLGKGFGGFVQKAGAIQACLSADATCVMDLTKTDKYNYIYLSKNLRTDNCEPLQYPQSFSLFVEALRATPGLNVVYETTSAIVYQSR